MKISLNWLKTYLDISLTPHQISEILTKAGLEVDGLEIINLGLKDVVVGHVVEAAKHPNADKLCVATVSDGRDTYQVVCGAPNCRIGLKTAFAKEGAVLKSSDGSSFTIKRTKIRGVESFGMLCSEIELGVGAGADGIIEFSGETPLGTAVESLYNDTIFEISLTPNLGHCASVLGVARELAAATETSIKSPITEAPEGDLSIEKLIKVSIQASDEVPRYCCRVIKNVVVGPSPDWMQRRLVASGLRPINNIVDITNYVVLEMGQPLHAFDYNTLADSEIIVRKAKAGESFVTLDEKKRLLAEGDLLICDSNKPIALAGIMGGANSEVSNTTTDLLLEAACFKPSTIRKTSKRLGLSTDASKRFERGGDPHQVVEALNYAARLIQKIAGGEVASGIVDHKTSSFSPLKIACRLNRINQILGTQLSISEVENVFQRLGIPYHWDGHNQFTLSVPTYRVDLKEEIDIIEEVARIYGYDNITKLVPFYQASSLTHAPMFLFEREMRTRLIAEGLQELLTCDLIGPSVLDIINTPLMPEEAVVKVLNPTSIEQSILRTSLLPGLLQLVKYNFDHQNHSISGFEVGRIHFKQPKAPQNSQNPQNPKDTLEGFDYKEQTVVGLILTGKQKPHQWDRQEEAFDFFDLKGIIENVLTELNIKDISFKPSHYLTLHSGRQASIFVHNLEIGSLGEVHPAIQRRLDVPQKIYFAELNLHDLMQVIKKKQLMTELPVYPSSERDWTVTLAEQVTLDQLLTAIQGAASPLLEGVTLVDIYRSEKIGANLKNVTLHFIYRDPVKTVEQIAVDAEHKRILSHVDQTFLHNTSEK